ncbi:phage major capsid protein [Bradyrhizobium elkanii]|uniref:phage major capsid protein n=1 Tax=Bradyrhizobium elkanii TaxID=29448 RepID=UPI002167E635|nr:phage major capsid protein [Bradyrhizobium elkanii]MCS3690940.1 HK97 family phage major capsid protein [Bradyrhizobium elkanii]
MSKKHELKQALAKVSDEIEVMASKSVDDGFQQDVYDALKEKFIEINKQIGRVEEAEKIAANLATPVPGQDRLTPFAPPSAHKLYGTLKNFKDREIEGRTVKAVDQAYTAGMWFKATLMDNAEAKEWCKSRGVPIMKAQGEGVDSAGGFLVPEELMANIIVLREQFGVFRQQCQVVPMGSDTLNWPRRSGGLTAYFSGENTAVTESQAAWDNVNLTAKKAAVLTRMSTEIEQDAVVAIADWLVGEMAYAFASKEDDCGFNGDGTSTYGGMRGLTQLAVDGSHNACKVTASSATWNAMVLKDLTSLIGALPQYAIQNAQWYMSQQAFYTIVATITAGAGGNRLDVLTNAIEKRLLGFPVVIAQKLPIATPGSGKAMFFFGDLTKASMMGERRGVTIKRSDHRYFENDQIGLLGTERFDINTHDMGDNTNAGPVVAMISP